MGINPRSEAFLEHTTSGLMAQVRPNLDSIDLHDFGFHVRYGRGCTNKQSGKCGCYNAQSTYSQRRRAFVTALGNSLATALIIGR